jgi:hypothetical protein
MLGIYDSEGAFMQSGEGKEKQVHISWSFLFCSSGVGAWEGMEENIFVGRGSLRKVYRNVMLTYGMHMYIIP